MSTTSRRDAGAGPAPERSSSTDSLEDDVGEPRGGGPVRGSAHDVRRAAGAEVIGTFFLVYTGTATAVAAVLIGGPSTGGAVNPVRALGPMILNLDLSSAWVYVVGPIAGGMAAAQLFVRVIGRSGEPARTSGRQTA